MPPPEPTFTLGELRSAVGMEPDDEAMIQFIDDNREWALQVLRSAYAAMQREIAAERAAQEEARLQEMYDAIVHDTPRYLRQLNALRRLSSHNSQGIAEAPRSSKRHRGHAHA